MSSACGRIAVFDFDGTITTKDTFIEFARFAVGDMAFIAGLIHFLPQLVAYMLHFYPNGRIKEKLFSYFFSGMAKKKFDMLCELFYRSKRDCILRGNACMAVRRHLSQGDVVLIVSASISNWIIPFARSLNVHGVIGTEISTDSSGILTGRFLTSNCYGAEKVRRIKQLYPDYGSYVWIAYGDSVGDKELLEFADERYYKFFI